MFLSLCILGRQPALGLAELESLFGDKAVQPVGSQAALLDVEPAGVPFAFLGGTMKFCKVLTALDTTSWSDIQKFLQTAVPRHAATAPEGKLKLGLSVYGISTGAKQLTATGLELKKVLKASGRSARIVPNVEPALNSAQVLHNQLTAQLGWELVFVADGNRTIVAQTIAVQDIESYALRDRGRPRRDARVGMLPPKLAQTIVNLAVGTAVDPTCGPGKSQDKTILDPFCGTGVILQEAVLMGYNPYGTDADARMVEYTKTNLDWLGETLPHPPFTYRVEVGDATSFLWPEPANIVASEVYLGRPFTSPPSSTVLQTTVQDVNTITKKFLANLATQTKSGFRLCIAVPAWKTSSGLTHLPLLDAFDPPKAGSASTLSGRAKGPGVERVDHLTDMGYNRIRFVHAAQEDLIYHREGQIVARELVVLVRK